ncbi:hypothetical protein BDB00DRAFT_878267 [Zychaea mexicana]|uniref:uncharacterized protein n=1 Tax=Zychaea mexicana TaxID=64656 RepID=UPI0022FE6089|nr:uncharacterized protein BDB00DRAFT_878267 [Zychaea mexicana]KAI9484937.1 hypothetical protein BDB00DRAFT_878267 [Zychaea mexicana]
MRRSQEYAATTNSAATDMVTALSSRVVQDVWHALKRISVPKAHEIRRMLQRELTDAVFLMDQTDVKRVKDVLAKKGKMLDIGGFLK